MCFRYVYIAFTTDGKLRRILNSEDTSSEGKARRNQELYELAKFFNCETGGIPPKDFHQGLREKLSREIKQAAKEAREQIIGTANIVTSIGALLAGVAAVLAFLFTR